jgi:hypothetical protein
VEPTQTEAKKPKKRWRILSSVFLFALIAGAMYFCAARYFPCGSLEAPSQSAKPALAALRAGRVAHCQPFMFGIALHISLRALDRKTHFTDPQSSVSVYRTSTYGHHARGRGGTAAMQLYYMLGYGVEVSQALRFRCCWSTRRTRSSYF